MPEEIFQSKATEATQIIASAKGHLLRRVWQAVQVEKESGEPQEHGASEETQIRMRLLREEVHVADAVENPFRQRPQEHVQAPMSDLQKGIQLPIRDGKTPEDGPRAVPVQLLLLREGLQRRGVFQGASQDPRFQLRAVEVRLYDLFESLHPREFV